MNWLRKKLAENKAACLQIRGRWYSEEEWPLEIYLQEIRSTTGEVFLEIGCGWRADVLRRAADRFRFRIGLDPDCHSQAETDQSVVLLSGDGAALPLRDESVDVIGMRNVAEHFIDPAAVLRECARVLRPNGRLIVQTVNGRFPPIMLARLLPPRVRGVLNFIASGTAHDDTFPAFYRANSLKQLRTLAGAVGLTPVKLTYISHHPTYLLFSPLVYRLGILLEQVVRRVEALGPLRHFLHVVFVKPVGS